MHAIDTNVLVRLISRDDASQTKRAENDIKKGAWVSHIVLLESVWVLRSVYSLNHAKISLAIQMLLRHEKLIFQNVDVIEKALSYYQGKPKLGFSDCLILATAQKEGFSPLSTFDKSLAALANAREI